MILASRASPSRTFTVALTMAVLLWAMPRTAHADEFTLTLLQLEATGTGKAALGAIEERIKKDLGEAGATVKTLPRKRRPRRSCLKSTSCVRRLLGKNKSNAALTVSVLRLGPKVQITIRVLRGDNGMEVRSATMSHPAEGFPGSWSPRADIEPMLTAFSEFVPAAVTPVAAVEPKPEATLDPTPLAALDPASDPEPAKEAPSSVDPATETIAPATVASSIESSAPTSITSPPPPPADGGSAVPMVLTIGGAVLIAGGGVAIGVAESVRRDAASTGSAKETALVYGWAGVGAAAVGVVGAAIGAILWADE